MDQAYRKRIFEPCLELIRKDAILRNKTENIEDYMCRSEKELLDEIDNGKLIISRIVVTTGPRCTLKCKDCANLMPHYREPYDLDINSILEDVRTLFSKIDKCICVNIVGGEPFMYPYLDVLLEELIKNDKLLYVELTTNATIIPEEKVLKLLQSRKVVVNISDYGNIVLLSRFASKMDEYGILSYCISDEKWIDCGNVIARGRNERELRELYCSCGSAKMCKTLMKGKLFDCARAASLYDLNYTSDIFYIDIYSEKKKDVVEFFAKETSKACDYCDFSVPQKKYIAPAEQINGVKFAKSKYTVIARKDHAALVEAKEWWQGQCGNMEKQNVELKEWIRQLEEAKEYYLGQIDGLQKENQELRGEK